MIAIFRAQLDSHFEILQGGVRFAGKAIESGQGVMNIVPFRRGFAGLIEALTRVVPAPNIHHSYAALVVLVGGARILFLAGLHALFSDFDVHARAIGQLFTGTFQHFLQLLLGLGKFLLVEEREGLIVQLELRLNARIDQFHAPTLGRGRRGLWAFFSGTFMAPGAPPCPTSRSPKRAGSEEKPLEPPS